jgi:hypothetical protein
VEVVTEFCEIAIDKRDACLSMLFITEQDHEMPGLSEVLDNRLVGIYAHTRGREVLKIKYDRRRSVGDFRWR